MQSLAAGVPPLTLKQTARSLLESFGLSFGRLRSDPFGLDWIADLRWCMNLERLVTAFDVGANIGQTALSLSRAFPGCRVSSFEPVETTFLRLEKNLWHPPSVEAFDVR